MSKQLNSSPLRLLKNLLWLSRNGMQLWQLIKLHQQTITQLEARVAALEMELLKQRRLNNQFFKGLIELKTEVVRNRQEEILRGDCP